MGADISGFGTMATKICTEDMNGKLYCDIVQRQLKSSMVQMLKQKIKFYFQEDLTFWHISNIVKEKIANLKLDILEWALKSLYLNPIERLRSILDKRLASKPIYSRAALADRLQEEWNNIDRD